MCNHDYDANAWKKLNDSKHGAARGDYFGESMPMSIDRKTIVSGVKKGHHKGRHRHVKTLNNTNNDHDREVANIYLS